VTHVDDLYEPGDDREPEPCDWYPAPEPLDLDGLQKLYALAEEPGGLPAWGRIVYLRVPELIAELREARQRIAEWEALPTREEWAVTLGKVQPDPADPIQDGDFAEAALDLARKHKGQAWRRTLTVHLWEPISLDAPF
jgi:hypothetical protein